MIEKYLNDKVEKCFCSKCGTEDITLANDIYFLLERKANDQRQIDYFYKNNSHSSDRIHFLESELSTSQHAVEFLLSLCLKHIDLKDLIKQISENNVSVHADALTNNSYLEEY